MPITPEDEAAISNIATKNQMPFVNQADKLKAFTSWNTLGIGNGFIRPSSVQSKDPNIVNFAATIKCNKNKDSDNDIGHFLFALNTKTNEITYKAQGGKGPDQKVDNLKSFLKNLASKPLPQLKQDTSIQNQSMFAKGKKPEAPQSKPRIGAHKNVDQVDHHIAQGNVPRRGRSG